LPICHRLRVFERLRRARGIGVRHAGSVVHRTAQRRERLPGAPDCELTTVAELPALVGV
jgi:hypothetical protein